VIAGERTPGAIRTMRPWSQPHDEYARVRIAEARHGLAPVFPAEIGASLYASDFLPVRHQPRAKRASLDFSVEYSKPFHSGVRLTSWDASSLRIYHRRRDRLGRQRQIQNVTGHAMVVQVVEWPGIWQLCALGPPPLVHPTV